jgi:hypothetical protein
VDLRVLPHTLRYVCLQMHGRPRAIRDGSEI